MSDVVERAAHLGWVEVALRDRNKNLANLRIEAQCHYGPRTSIAFIEVFGVDNDTARRRAIRKEAGEMLTSLGYDVSLEPGRDIFFVSPVRARSAHERLQMLTLMQKSLRASVGDDPESCSNRAQT